MYEPTTKSNPTSGPAAGASLQFAIKHLVLSIKIVGHSFALYTFFVPSLVAGGATET